MKRASAIVLALACLVLGAWSKGSTTLRHGANPLPLAQRIAPPEAASPVVTPVPFAAIQFDHEPLWAYGIRPAPEAG